MRLTLGGITLGLGLALAALNGAARAEEPASFAWKDGDRVVLIGDTLIERDQKYGYLETILTAKNPDKSITFRNLGWSGDTVRGLSRARFGPPAEGWQHLIDHVNALTPTVLILGYGMADSFDGPAGLPAFVSGLNQLVDAVSASKPRLIFLSPIAHIDMGRPLPDPAAHNKDLERYTEAIGKVAKERKATYIDLYHPFLPNPSNTIPLGLTDNGIHLSEEGSWLVALIIARELCGPLPNWSVGFDHDGRLRETVGTTATVDSIKTSGVRFTALDRTLPIPWNAMERSDSHQPLTAQRRKQAEREEVRNWILGPRTLSAELPEGRYLLTIDGTVQKFDSVARLNELIWAKGVELTSGPEFDQVEKLRQVINRKNELYFYRWRPQNETYLFGFRKHEQGNNAREIPLFDPLVDEQEKRIAKLKVPVPHVYELVRRNEVAK